MRLWPRFGKKPEQRSVWLDPALLRNGYTLSGTGVNVNPDTALRLMAVWACVRLIAEDVASLPLFLYRRTDRGKEKATAHPLYALLHDAPNSEQTSMQFRETLLTHLLLHGNAFAWKEMVNGRVAALWPITPTRVSVMRNTRTGLLDYIVQPPGNSDKKLFAAREIFHVAGLSYNGITGMSPIQYARDTIGLGIAQEQFAGGFFRNGARPSLVLEHPGAMSAEAHERMRADFEALHTGLDNAQRVALLEEGMKAHALMIAQEDAQFLEQRKFSVEEIARLYRVPPHKIAQLDRATFSNIEQQSIDYVVSTLRPWLVRLEQAINSRIIPNTEQGDFYAEFSVEGLLRGDNAARAEFYRTMWNIGCFTANEIRALENMNPVEGGDELFVPANMMPASMAADAMAAGLMAPAGSQVNGDGAAAGRGMNGRSKDYATT